MSLLQDNVKSVEFFPECGYGSHDRRENAPYPHPEMQNVNG